jgi:hypothetical protein
VGGAAEWSECRPSERLSQAHVGATDVIAVNDPLEHFPIEMVEA